MRKQSKPAFPAYIVDFEARNKNKQQMIDRQAQVLSVLDHERTDLADQMHRRQ